MWLAKFISQFSQYVASNTFFIPTLPSDKESFPVEDVNDIVSLAVGIIILLLM